MYRIAIVDDEKVFSDRLTEYIARYRKENGTEFEVTAFNDSVEFWEQFESEYDLILLDIEMPGMDGTELAHKIREKDEDVVLVFITNMAQYAIHGYEVGALDFVTKPLNYYTFSMKLTRALKRVAKREMPPIMLTFSEGIKKLEAGQIFYLEVQNRMLHYHTDDGEYVVRGTMQAAEEKLAKYSFAKCNHWYLVNLAHVTEVRKNIVVVGGYELEISRRNRSAFLQALTDYMGGGN